MAWPVELQVAAFGAVSAAAGYGIKSAIDWRKGRRQERDRTIAELQRLESLLNAGHQVFSMQKAQVKQLRELLKENHPDKYDPKVGFDEMMERCYPVFDKHEKEIHSIIRSYTQHSMRTINLAVSEWLRSDVLFKTGVVESNRKDQLAKSLFALEIHLLLWHAKYEAWIPNNPEHALVYMADEKQHGLGFPRARYYRRVRPPHEEERLKLEGTAESPPREQVENIDGFAASEVEETSKAQVAADSLHEKDYVKVDGVDEHVASVLNELRGRRSKASDPVNANSFASEDERGDSGRAFSVKKAPHG